MPVPAAPSAVVSAESAAWPQPDARVDDRRDDQQHRHARARKLVGTAPELAVYDGNHDGNVGNQYQARAATGSQLLQRGRAELAIRYT
jgi:hypothetical protein